MAMSRTELNERINNLPLFEKRPVFVGNEDTDDINVEKTKQIHQSICMVDGTESYAYVTPNYKLVQFKEVFRPILNSISEDLKGYLIHDGGFAILKIFPEMDELKNKDDQFGLLAMNSVDMSSSIIVRFCVRHNEYQFTIPTNIAGLKERHTGKAEQVTKDYISMIGEVKSAWKQIITEFPKYEIVMDLEKCPDDIQALEFGTVLNRLKIGKRLAKKLRESLETVTKDGRRYTLWDIVIDVMQNISDSKYKTDVNREKRIATLCQLIFEYSVMLQI